MDKGGKGWKGGITAPRGAGTPRLVINDIITAVGTRHPSPVVVPTAFATSQTTNYPVSVTQSFTLTTWTATVNAFSSCDLEL